MAQKIMYLIDRYQDPHAGTEGQLLQLIQHLDRTRYDPAMTVLRDSKFISSNEFACPVSVLDITRLSSIGSIVKVLRYAIELRRQNYQLVHCFFNDSSRIAPPLLRMLGIRVLVSRRDMGFWYTPLTLALLRLVALFVDRFVANSYAVKEVVQRREWVRSKKITVIHNGYVVAADIGTEGSAELLLPEVPAHVPVIGIVANLRPIKRIDVAIKALALVRGQFPEVRLVVVGGDNPSPRGGTMRAELEELASRQGVRNNVIFVGAVRDAAPYIDRFAVAVLCSESEGFSNSIIEYMQAGRPVVCTDVGGNPELVEDGHTGFLLPVGDARALAQRLRELLSDRDLAHELGGAARAAVSARYSHTKMVAEHMACYDEVLRARRFKMGYGCLPSRAE